MSRNIIITEPAPGYGFRTTADAVQAYAKTKNIDIEVYDWIDVNHFYVVSNVIFNEDCIVHCMTLPVCEYYHHFYNWPRCKMIGIFYSMWEMIILDEQVNGKLDFITSDSHTSIKAHMLTEKRMRQNYISPTLQDICNQYSKVGYLNLKQIEMLPSVKNLVYMPHAVKPNFFNSPHKDKEKLNVGVAHRMNTVKNLPLADQIKQLCDNSARFNFMAIGTYNKWILHDDTPNFYKELDVFLVTSFSEGTPFVAYEAGAAGVPIISTNCGSMPEYLTSDNGFIVESTVEAFAEKLNYLYEHRDVLHTMKTNMYNRTSLDHNYDVTFPYWLNMFGMCDKPLPPPHPSLPNLPPYPVPVE